MSREDVKRHEPNRVILLTPPGAAAIAVARLVGEKTRAFLAGHFSRPLTPGRAVHGVLADGQRVLDDPLVLIHDDGLIADISLHGGPWVVRQFIDLTQRNGFEPVQSNQLPLPSDAVDGDDDIERQMLSLLPLARTELALIWLVKRAAKLRRKNRPEDLLADPSLRWLLHPPRIAIVGPPNAGKSTLANQLFGQERSIIADAPGTTRDWIGEIADIDGLAVFLIDTPGLRDTDDPIERTAIQASGPVVQTADLVLLVVDASRPFAEQAHWGRQFPGALVIRNKCDLEIPSHSSVRGSMKLIAGSPQHSFPHLHTIASAGRGIDPLRQQIRRHFVRAWRQP